MSILLRNVTPIDTNSPYHNKKIDILIDKSEIKKIGKNLKDKAKKEINADGQYISSSWIDTFCELGFPGGEDRENSKNAINAARNSGIGHLFIAPNNLPTTSNASSVAYIKNTLNNSEIKCHVIGSISQDIESKTLAEMMEMNEAGAIAFSDGWKPIQRDILTQQALQYTKAFNGIIIQIPINEELNQDGIMNEGINSTQYGINSMPAYGEEVFIMRQIELCKYTNGRIHISGITTKKSLDLITKAKKENINISCSVTPYHLLYDDSMLSDYNGLYKVNPPLRTQKDREALIKGIKDGNIDAISSHHRPQNWDGKETELAYAKWGMASLDVLWQMLLKAAPNVSIEDWIKLLVETPSKIFGIDQSIIEEGSKGTWTQFNTDENVIISTKNKKSLAYNVPLLNENLKGRAIVI